MTADALEQFDREAFERYLGARDRARGAFEAWEEAGQPLTIVLSNGCEAISAGYKVLLSAEAHAGSPVTWLG